MLKFMILIRTLGCWRHRNRHLAYTLVGASIRSSTRLIPRELCKLYSAVPPLPLLRPPRVLLPRQQLLLRQPPPRLLLRRRLRHTPRKCSRQSTLTGQAPSPLGAGLFR